MRHPTLITITDISDYVDGTSVLFSTPPNTDWEWALAILRGIDRVTGIGNGDGHEIVYSDHVMPGESVVAFTAITHRAPNGAEWSEHFHN